jgi:hypothetical protein
VTEPAEALTLRDRIVGMGLAEERADEHLAANRVRGEGEYVTDGGHLVTRAGRG